LTAALSAAGVAGSAAADVFSANIVGYVTKDLVAGFNLIANPLDSGNTVASVFADAPVGTVVFKYNGTGFDSALNDEFDGWLGDISIEPGEGVFVNSPAATTVTFVGEVRTGDLSTPLGAGFTIASSQVPQAGGIETDLGYTPAVNDTIFVFNGTSYDAFLFDEFDGWLPSEPSLEVAQSVWISKGAAGSWDRTFTVDQ
jgi:hypothetical protein